MIGTFLLRFQNLRVSQLGRDVPLGERVFVEVCGFLLSIAAMVSDYGYCHRLRLALFLIQKESVLFVQFFI